MNRSERPSRWARLWLLAPFMVGFGLRFFRLGKQALFLDEAYTADLVGRSWSSLLEVARQGVHPVFFYALIKTFMSILPLNEWTLRLLPAVLSTLALASAIGMTRRLAGVRAAVYAGWLLSWSSLHLYYAQEARMYSLLELLWIVSPWVLACALRADGTGRGPRPRQVDDRDTAAPGATRTPRPISAWLPWIGWALLSAIAVHTHFYGLVLWGVSALGSAIVLLRRRSWRRLCRWATAQAIVAAAATPLLFWLLTSLERGVPSTWAPTWRDPLTLWSLTLFGFSPARAYFLNSSLLSLYPWSEISQATWAILGLLLAAGAVAGWRLAIVRPTLGASSGGIRCAGWLVGLAGLCPVLLTALALGLTQQRLWALKPFIGAVVWLLIGLAIGWSRYPRWVGWGVIGLLFVLNAGSLWAYEERWVKDHARTAFQTWPETGGTALVLDRYYASMLWNYYQPGQANTVVYGITPQRDGSFSLRRMAPDGTLRATWHVATCRDLSAHGAIGLFDPGGRRFVEGKRWPSCLHERPGWTFDVQHQKWERVPQLLP